MILNPEREVYADLGYMSVYPRGVTRHRDIVWELVRLGVLAIIIVGLLTFPPMREEITPRGGSLILTGLAVAIGTAATILLMIAGRLALHHRAMWIGAALSVYSTAVVPFAVSGRHDITLSAALLVAHWTVVVLLALAVRPPRIGIVGEWAGWVLAGCGMLLALVTALVVPLAQEMVHFAISSTLAEAALVTTGCALATALAVNGWRERNGPLRRVGFGLLVIAAAHLYGIVSGVPVSEPNLAFSVSRLLGLVLTLLASLELARGAWHTHQAVYGEIGAAHLERVANETAERDHELRTGLAALAGFHTLLGAPLNPDDAESLRRAVASELRRLEAMLEAPPVAARHEGYLVAPVLTGLVTLRRFTGRDVELDIDDRLRAAGSPEALAQIMTNLLANCERHASGSAVQITVRGDRDKVLIEVADGGPGIPRGFRWAMLKRGNRGGRTGGSGLGLHICRQLLAAQGGTLRILTPRAGNTGCTVLVELPSLPDGAPQARPMG